MTVEFAMGDSEVDDAEVIVYDELEKPSINNELYRRDPKTMPRYWVWLSREARLKFLTFEKDSLEQRHVVKVWLVEQATKHNVRRKHIHEWIDKALNWAFTPSKREVDAAIVGRSDFVKERKDHWERGRRKPTFIRSFLAASFPGWVDPNPPITLGPRVSEN